MRWQDWIAATFIVLSAGLQSAFSASSNTAALLNFPMIAIALLSTYPRIHVVVLTTAFAVTRIAIGTESIPITLFRSILATFLSIKSALSLINHGWLLAVITVISCIVIDLIAAVIANPKYAAMLTMTDILLSVLFNAGITLLCAVPLEIYYRKKHIHGF